MSFLIQIFGEGRDLTVVQMSSRSFIIFLYALVLFRIAGRRSIGLGAPFDYIILVLLGAVLSNAIVGNAPFLAVMAAGFVVALFHRVLGYAGIISSFIGRFIKGTKIVLYHKGNFNIHNMKRGLVSREDILEEVRLQINDNSLDSVETIFIERNGQISVVKKQPITQL